MMMKTVALLVVMATAALSIEVYNDYQEYSLMLKDYGITQYAANIRFDIYDNKTNVAGFDVQQDQARPKALLNVRIGNVQRTYKFESFFIAITSKQVLMFYDQKMMDFIVPLKYSNDTTIFDELDKKLKLRFPDKKANQTIPEKVNSTPRPRISPQDSAVHIH